MTPGPSERSFAAAGPADDASTYAANNNLGTALNEQSSFMHANGDNHSFKTAVPYQATMNPAGGPGTAA